MNYNKISSLSASFAQDIILGFWFHQSFLSFPWIGLFLSVTWVLGPDHCPCPTTIATQTF